MLSLNIRISQSVPVVAFEAQTQVFPTQLAWFTQLIAWEFVTGLQPNTINQPKRDFPSWLKEKIFTLIASTTSIKRLTNTCANAVDYCACTTIETNRWKTRICWYISKNWKSKEKERKWLFVMRKKIRTNYFLNSRDYWKLYFDQSHEISNRQTTIPMEYKNCNQSADK